MNEIIMQIRNKAKTANWFKSQLPNKKAAKKTREREKNNSVNSLQETRIIYQSNAEL